MSTRRSKPDRSVPELPVGGATRHDFKDPALLRWALTHRSLSYERNPDQITKPSEDNEQLEFVGDAVLGLIVAETLFRRFPDSREGELTRLRASLVSRKHLAEVAERIELGKSLRLGRGEEQSGGRHKPALLANALEAIIAALYLDGGLAAARKFIEAEIVLPALPQLEDALQAGGKFSGAIGDYKSALQEHLQAVGAGQPRYILKAQSGPDHRRLFRVEVHLAADGDSTFPIAESEGTTKKQAQQEAARLALERLQTRSNDGAFNGAAEPELG